MRKYTIARIFNAAAHFFTVLGLADVNPSADRRVALTPQR